MLIANVLPGTLAVVPPHAVPADICLVFVQRFPGGCVGLFRMPGFMASRGDGDQMLGGSTRNLQPGRRHISACAKETKRGKFRGT